jgi:imidazolonepropionase-like amidohydrolase
MNTTLVRRACAAACLCILALGGPLGRGRAAADAPDVWAITGARIVPVSGPPIEKGTVILRDGLVESVGPSVSVPPDARVIDGAGLTVYPGLVDAFSFVEEEQKPQTGPPQPPKAPDRANPPGVTPARKALDLVRADGRLESTRTAGITTALVVPKGGIFRGRSALVDMNGATARAMSLRTPVAEHVAFETQGGFAGYPGSLMGVISVIRQELLDAGQYRQAWDRYNATPRGYRRPEPNDDLDALLPVLDRRLPVVLEANEDKEIRRALRLADEFKLNAIVAGGRESWKTAADLKARGVPVLLSLNFPERPTDIDAESRETLKTVQDRLDAPATAAKLQRAGVRFAFTSNGLKTPKQFLTNAIKAVQAGLSKDDALRAMTLTPAQILGAGDQIGSIEAGKVANLLVTDGDLFDEKTKIRYVFVDGERYEIKSEAAPKPGEAPGIDVTGTWTVTVTTPGGNQQATLTLTQKGTELGGTFANPDFGTSEVRNGTVSGKQLSFTVTLSPPGQTVDVSFTATVEGNTMTGTATVPGQGSFDFSGTRPQGGRP